MNPEFLSIESLICRGMSTGGAGYKPMTQPSLVWRGCPAFNCFRNGFAILSKLKPNIIEYSRVIVDPVEKITVIVFPCPGQRLEIPAPELQGFGLPINAKSKHPVTF